MDFITGTGIDWVLAIQSLGGWLELPMRFLTFLGSEDFFFIVLPLIYWSIDAKVGLQVGLILATNNFINSVFKLLFASPRPYWVSDQVRPVVGESSFGAPSGHAQNAAAIWGIMAHGIRRIWAWVAAGLLVFLIGFSRPYLGVHFVQDVLVGWLLGGIVLVLFTRLWEPAARWLAGMTLARQVGLAFVIALLMVLVGALLVAGLDGFVVPQEWRDNARPTGVEPDPVSLEGFITTAGSFFGLAAGAAWIAAQGGYQTSGPLEKRAMRYVVGVIGVLILWMGLGQVFPDDANWISYLLRFLRYTLVGFWVTAGAPWLFFHFKLADGPKM
jgi:membrane-associated phospholipid phosphatase